jgi:acyl-coenzyme A thioesterase PaaI-like protein
MKTEIVNEELFPGNTCFGCGLDNPLGLKVEIYRDGEKQDQLVGIFDPPDHMTGFPGITHGGVIYTALDCIAAWVPTALRRETKAIWILRSATVKYHKAAHGGESLRLRGVIEQEGRQWEPMVVHAEARNCDGELLAEGTFKVIPLPVDKFKQVSGLDHIPENLGIILDRVTQ